MFYPAKRQQYIQNITAGETIKIDSIPYVVYQIDPVGPNMARYGWTHVVYLHKPRGKKFFSISWNNQTGVISRICGE